MVLSLSPLPSSSLYFYPYPVYNKALSSFPTGVMSPVIPLNPHPLNVREGHVGSWKLYSVLAVMRYSFPTRVFMELK